MFGLFATFLQGVSTKRMNGKSEKLLHTRSADGTRCIVSRRTSKEPYRTQPQEKKYLSETLAGPTSRDLNADVNAAATNLENFETSLGTYVGHLGIFHDEIKFKISLEYAKIERSLGRMNLSNSTIANVTALTERAVSISTVHVTEVILSLGLVRNEVITIHDALYNLPELETATNAGTAQYNKTLEEITSINAFVPRLFTEANEQIQNAIIGQVCQPATDVYIGLQVIQSSLNDYYRKIEDDQVLYQFRASLANNALQTVIAQPVVLFSLLSVKEFTMKQIGGLALLLAVKVLTAQVALAESTSSNNLPSTRDLNDDISAAGVALKNFDFEVDRYTGVLNVFQDEIDISIRNTYGEIERNLQLIPE
ncbi:Hypothetical predicted protein [Cloeon dipterum]|nr:Hypothetical predicted protein [Cloeon dipterum]